MAVWVTPEERFSLPSHPEVGVDNHIQDHKAILVALYQGNTPVQTIYLKKSGDDHWDVTAVIHFADQEQTLTWNDSQIEEIFASARPGDPVIVTTPYGEPMLDGSTYEVGDEILFEHFNTFLSGALQMDLESLADEYQSVRSTIADLTARLEALEATNPE